MRFYRKLCRFGADFGNFQQTQGVASITNDDKNKRVHKLVDHKLVNSLVFR